MVGNLAVSKVRRTTNSGNFPPWLPMLSERQCSHWGPSAGCSSSSWFIKPWCWNPPLSFFPFLSLQHRSVEIYVASNRSLAKSSAVGIVCKLYGCTLGCKVRWAAWHCLSELAQANPESTLSQTSLPTNLGITSPKSDFSYEAFPMSYCGLQAGQLSFCLAISAVTARRPANHSSSSQFSSLRRKDLSELVNSIQCSEVNGSDCIIHQSISCGSAITVTGSDT